MATKKLTDIPPEDVDDVVSDFESEGCTNVVKTLQPNGKFTVTATCPDE